MFRPTVRPLDRCLLTLSLCCPSSPCRSQNFQPTTRTSTLPIAVRSAAISGAERPIMAATNKPPYRIPSMAEIGSLPYNGLVVASTFSGCGGSCLGYRMAGYRILWANEFSPAVAASYRANHDSFLDPRDIRKITADEILVQIGKKKGEIDLLDGSPPCQAFSTAGKRQRGWGKERRYAHGASQKNEELFSEFIRLVRGLLPRVFLAENVSGLIKGVAKGFFLEILRALKASGYRVEARLLDA